MFRFIKWCFEWFVAISLVVGMLIVLAVTIHRDEPKGGWVEFKTETSHGEMWIEDMRKVETEIQDNLDKLEEIVGKRKILD